MPPGLAEQSQDHHGDGKSRRVDGSSRGLVNALLTGWHCAG